MEKEKGMGEPDRGFQEREGERNKGINQQYGDLRAEWEELVDWKGLLGPT